MFVANTSNRTKYTTTARVLECSQLALLRLEQAIDPRFGWQHLMRVDREK
jgi:hypothetical protein